MSFRHKIFFGYLLMSLVFMGGILLCLRTLGPIERNFERLAAENLPVLNLIQNIRTQGSMLHAEMLEMSALLSLEVTPESKQALIHERAEIEHTEKQLLVDLEYYFKLIELYFPEESSYIPLLQTQVDQLLQINKELNEQTAGQSGSFSLAMNSRFEDLEQGFLAVTNEIVSFEVREIQMRREQVDASVAKARVWIGSIMVLSLGVALILPNFLFRLRSSSESADAGGRRRSPVPRHYSQRD